MIWTEVKPCTGGVQWEAYPSDTHAIDIWPHEKEGFSWCVITDDVDDNAPEGWSATVEDAKRHAEQAYLEWLDVTEGRKPIPGEHACGPDTEHCSCVPHLRAEIERLRAQRILSNEDFARSFDLGLAAGEKRERVAVVTYLHKRRVDTMEWDGSTNSVSHTYNHAAAIIERGEHRREETP